MNEIKIKNKATLCAVGNYVIVEVEKPEEAVRSGIILTTEPDRKNEGVIISVGNGEAAQKTGLKIGDRVLFSKYARNEVDNAGQLLAIMHAEDVIGIL